MEQLIAYDDNPGNATFAWANMDQVCLDNPQAKSNERQRIRVATAVDELIFLRVVLESILDKIPPSLLFFVSLGS